MSFFLNAVLSQCVPISRSSPLNVLFPLNIFPQYYFLSMYFSFNILPSQCPPLSMCSSASFAAFLTLRILPLNLAPRTIISSKSCLMTKQWFGIEKWSMPPTSLTSDMVASWLRTLTRSSDCSPVWLARISSCVVGIIWKFHTLFTDNTVISILSTFTTVLIHLPCHGCGTRRSWMKSVGTRGKRLRGIRLINEGFVGIGRIDLVNSTGYFCFENICLGRGCTAS